ncbi:hypothetical protein ACIRLA_36150 [Streptomyces sp. NPDC102364]|uniref:hypothetical protein n=1 Tax=Streptomyces sp. NPDC102364 TaxID=3366161 RepID=UPI0038285B52
MSPADILLLREINAAAAKRHPDPGTYTQQERTTVERIHAGRPCPQGPVAMLPIAQLYVHDVPGLLPPEGADLLQVLWCPFDRPGQNMPRTALFWRSASAVGGVLAAPPQPSAIQSEHYLPRPCLVCPEQVTEFPSSAELNPGLRAQVRTWSVSRERRMPLPGAPNWSGGSEYDCALSVSPGWKVGGWAPWSFTDPAAQLCRDCGSLMVPMLTIASQEWQAGYDTWTPYEDRLAAAAAKRDGTLPDPATPTLVTIGDGHNLQIYACPTSPQHPHTASVQ